MDVECPHCQRAIQAPDEAAGRKTRCPYCQQPFRMPSLEEPPAPLPVAPRVVQWTPDPTPTPARVIAPPSPPSPPKKKEHWTTTYNRFVISFWAVVAVLALTGWALKSGVLTGTMTRESFEARVMGKGFIGVRNAVGAPDDERISTNNVFWYYYNRTRSGGSVNPVTIVNFGPNGTVFEVVCPRD